MQLTLKNRGQEVSNIDYPNSTYLVVSKVGYLLGLLHLPGLHADLRHAGGIRRCVCVMHI